MLQFFSIFCENLDGKWRNNFLKKQKSFNYVFEILGNKKLEKNNFKQEKEVISKDFSEKSFMLSPYFYLCVNKWISINTVSRLDRNQLMF